jgi:hypothetical protein
MTRSPNLNAITKRAALTSIITIVGSDGASAQYQLSNDEISKEIENPVTRHVTLPLRYQADFDDGPTQATKSTFEIDQAVVPFRLNDDWALITRNKLPWEAEPPKKVGEHWADGFANGYTTFFLSPERGHGFYWGTGPVLYYPSASNSALGVHKWGTGPSVAFIKEDESPWVFGSVVNNIWSLGGSPASSQRTNELLLNPFVSYHFADGWSVGSSPNITANWIAEGNKWTVPVGGGISKSMLLSEQPVKFAIDAYYNAARPKADSDPWLLQVTLTFLFPK